MNSFASMAGGTSVEIPLITPLRSLLNAPFSPSGGWLPKCFLAADMWYDVYASDEAEGDCYCVVAE